MATPQIKPVRSYGQFVEFADECLAVVRRMLHVSRKHEYLASLDRHMADCWKSSLCGRTPNPQERAACWLDRVEAEGLVAAMWPGVRELAAGLRSIGAYFDGLPPAPGEPAGLTCHDPRCKADNEDGARFCRRCGKPLPAVPPPLPAAGGWDLPKPMPHPDSVIKPLGEAIKDAKCLHLLDETEPTFKALYDALVEMARWTRTSLHPSRADRAKASLKPFGEAELAAALRQAAACAAANLRAFHGLYVNMPER